MTSKQKSKGNSFEREVANYLTKLTGKTYTRSAGSGAYVGGSNNHRIAYINAAQTKTCLGDIVCPDNCIIECKSYASIPWHQIIQGECKQLDKWIAQLEHDLSSVSSEWYGELWIKITRQGIYKVSKTDSGAGCRYKGWFLEFVPM